MTTATLDPHSLTLDSDLAAASHDGLEDVGRNVLRHSENAAWSARDFGDLAAIATGREWKRGDGLGSYNARVCGELKRRAHETMRLAGHEPNGKVSNASTRAMAASMLAAIGGMVPEVLADVERPANDTDAPRAAEPGPDGGWAMRPDYADLVQALTSKTLAFGGNNTVRQLIGLACLTAGLRSARETGGYDDAGWLDALKSLAAALKPCRGEKEACDALRRWTAAQLVD